MFDVDIHHFLNHTKRGTVTNEFPSILLLELIYTGGTTGKEFSC